MLYQDADLIQVMKIICVSLPIKKLKMIGIIRIDKIKTMKISIAAKIPNSISIALFVKMKVAKPNAVVVLVKKIAFPIF